MDANAPQLQTQTSKMVVCISQLEPKMWENGVQVESQRFSSKKRTKAIFHPFLPSYSLVTKVAHHMSQSRRLELRKSGL